MSYWLCVSGTGAMFITKSVQLHIQYFDNEAFTEIIYMHDAAPSRKISLRQCFVI